MSDSWRERDAFGDQLQSRVEQLAYLHPDRLIRHPNSLDASSGIPGIQFTYMFREHEVEIAMYLLPPDDPSSGITFERLLGTRAAIEAAFGEQLDWLPRKTRQVGRIRAICRRGGYLHRAHWREIQDDMIRSMSRLQRAVQPYLSGLDPESLQPTGDADELERRVEQLWAQGMIALPPGRSAPGKVVGQRLSYERDPSVIVWVQQAAQGRCDLCGRPAPFVRTDGRPYLEVHHVHTLAQGGPDTPENAVALCPNCHRRLHHAADAERQRDRLYSLIGRLIRPDNGTRR